MKRLIFVLFIFALVVNLSSLRVVLNNDRVKEGNFIKIKADKLYISRKKNLYTFSKDVVKEIHRKDKTLTWDETAQLVNATGRINYNKYSSIIDVNSSNFSRESLRFEKLDQRSVKVVLRDGLFLFGAIEAIEDSLIYLHEEDQLTLLRINKENVASIISDNIDVSNEYLGMVLPSEDIDHYDFDYIELDFSKSPDNINKDPNYTQAASILIGLDLGLDHKITHRGHSFSNNLNHLPYLRYEFKVNPDVGIGINIQPSKSLKDYSHVKFHYFSGYLSYSYPLNEFETMKLKINGGGNLFIGNSDYNTAGATKPGFYFSGGVRIITKLNSIVEVLYTMNHGGLDDATVTNHSISIGFGRFIKNKK